LPCSPSHPVKSYFGSALNPARIRPVANSTVSLSFHYRKSDIVRAMRFHYASLLRPRFDTAMAVGLAALGAYLWRSPSSHWSGVMAVAASAAFGLILVAAFLVIPPLAFRRQPRFHDEYSLTFSPEGIHFHTEHIDSHLEWSIYSRALVDAHSYLLYWGSRTFTTIPKRVFQNTEQQVTFEQLLTERVPKIVRKT
jgi:hypothetical protein